MSRKLMPWGPSNRTSWSSHKVLEVALFELFHSSINGKIATLGLMLMERWSHIIACRHAFEQIPHALRVGKVPLNDFGIGILLLESFLRSL